MKTKPFEVVVKLALFLCLLMASTAGATNFTLTVTAQGSGTVTRSPSNSSYPSNVVVTITATNNAGWYFADWSGDTNGSVNPLNVTVDSNLSITGNFLPFPVYTLTLVTNGQGTIDLSPAGGSYLSNSVVTATATPTAGWVFTGWSGGTNTSANPVSLTLSTNVSLTGAFAQLPAFDVQPVSVTNGPGSTVSFSAHAVGNAPLGYQWFFSGGSLTAATNTTLSLTNISSGQAGNYWIIATNSYGSATSQVASLTLTNNGGSTNVVNSPTDASLRAAMNLGGWVSLGFNGTLTLTNTINITSNVFLDGRNVSAIISGGNAVRLFYVAPGVTFGVTNLTLANGSYLITSSAAGTNADGGAIYNNGGTVTLTACTVVSNSAQALIFGGVARGGAIFNNGGTVSLNQSGFSNNAAIGGGPNSPNYNNATTGIGLGGAIYNTNGSLTIAGCNVSSNICSSICESVNIGGTGLTMGGAAYQASGSMTIASSTFSLNQALGGNGAAGFEPGAPASPAYGGALAANGGSVTIENSQFSANTAQGGTAGYHGAAGSTYGGAVYSAATLTAQDSSFFGNQTLAGGNTVVPNGASTGVGGFGGAIYNSGTAVLNRCLVSSNFLQGGSAIGGGPQEGIANGGNGLGGGIFNASQFAATNCTFALNSAVGGGGNSQNSGGHVLSSLGNAGNALGGGVFNNTNATFIAMNLTIASNTCSSPSGFAYTNGTAAGAEIANLNGTLRLHNSLIAYSGTNSNAYGTITDDGYNICSDGSANLFGGSSYNYTDPQLGPLGNYGGPTLCMALLVSSPAVDNADPSDFPATDQRGYVRPFGGGPDMGAYEYGSYPLVILSLNLTATATSVMLSFTASSTNTYRLQASTNLSTWTDLNTNGPFGTPTNISETISQQGFKTRFFRLLAQ